MYCPSYQPVIWVSIQPMTTIQFCVRNKQTISANLLQLSTSVGSNVIAKTNAPSPPVPVSHYPSQAFKKPGAAILCYGNYNTTQLSDSSKGKTIRFSCRRPYCEPQYLLKSACVWIRFALKWSKKNHSSSIFWEWFE